MLEEKWDTKSPRTSGLNSDLGFVCFLMRIALLASSKLNALYTITTKNWAPSHNYELEDEQELDWGVGGGLIDFRECGVKHEV